MLAVLGTVVTASAFSSLHILHNTLVVVDDSGKVRQDIGYPDLIWKTYSVLSSNF
jgi:hypothetical protein